MSGGPRRKPAEWQHAHAIDLGQLSGLLHYAVVGLDRSGAVRWATPSAARLLKSGGVERGESLLAPHLAPEVLEQGASLRAWLSGDLRPSHFECSSAGGESQQYVAVPLALSAESGADIAVLMLPPALGAGAESSSRGAAEESSQLRVLTERERQIAVQLLAGSRTALIAEELGISINTVRNHLKSIFRKLRVRSQGELVRTLRPRRGRSASS